MNKHTPAPWTNLPRMQCIPICGQDEVGISLGFINSSNTERTAEGKANAKLIAAAPDLLEALERISKMHDHEKPSFELAQLMYEAACIARSAIAKATQ